MLSFMYGMRCMDAETLLSDLGKQLRAARLRRGLTQAELAHAANLPRLKIGQIEAGKPTVAILAFAKAASVLGLAFGLEPARRPTLEELPDFLKKS